jgi:hypothetical protein
MNRTEILDAAMECVTKDRNATHGEHEDNFRVIADYWSTYLRSTGVHGVELTSVDVASLMILVKVARIASSAHHRDHWVDIAGYAACGGEIATRERE